MALKILAGLISVALMLTFVAPVVWKLKDVALIVVVTMGLVMMLVDLWQSLQSKDD